MITNIALASDDEDAVHTLSEPYCIVHSAPEQHSVIASANFDAVKSYSKIKVIITLQS